MPAPAVKPVVPAKPMGSVEPMPTVEGTNVFVAESAPQRRVLGGGLFGRRNRN
jgi:hypothetical protein